MNLSELRRLADEALLEFADACTKAGFADKWDAYRNEGAWPLELKNAHAEAMTKLHAFYGARDGDKGFLGSRGL